MRIIAGEFRGRRLVSPGDATRPITDRAKQSLFDILAPRLDGAMVYDLFSGTGSMGLECLSRRAKHATFFEKDRDALRGLRQNIATLGVGKLATVVAGDLFSYLARGSAVKRVDVVFLDPPYPFVRENPDALRRLAIDLAARHVIQEAVVIFRHDAADELELPPFERMDRRTYGGMAIDFLGLGATDQEATKIATPERN